MVLITVVAVAQLVESGIVIPVVVGSSPIGHPKISKTPDATHQVFFLFSQCTRLPGSASLAMTQRFALSPGKPVKLTGFPSGLSSASARKVRWRANRIEAMFNQS
jgi:hypothetical protein